MFGSCFRTLAGILISDVFKLFFELSEVNKCMYVQTTELTEVNMDWLQTHS